MITFSITYLPKHHLPLQVFSVAVVTPALLIGVTPHSPVLNADFSLTPTVLSYKVIVILSYKVTSIFCSYCYCNCSVFKFQKVVCLELIQRLLNYQSLHEAQFSFLSHDKKSRKYIIIFFQIYLWKVKQLEISVVLYYGVGKWACI